jgi:thiol-disulfide isomerase/thioredoxin
MKKLILTISLMFLFAPQAFAALKLNEPAPFFSLHDRVGKEFSLGDVVGAGAAKKGNGAIVSFFASWCVPCRHELPIMNSLTGELRSKGITVVLIDVKESIATVESLLKDLKVDQPVVLTDADGRASAKYEVRFLPTTFFIGADGRLKDVIYGGIDSAGQLRAGAEKLMQK